MAMATATLPQGPFAAEPGILDEVSGADREWWARESAWLAHLREMRAYYDAVADRDAEDAYTSGIAFPDEWESYPEGGASC